MGTPADAGDGPAARGNTPGLPEPTGRFPVGTTSLWLTDTTRPDPWAAGVAARELMVSLWYPATPSDGRRARYMTPAESELHLTSRGITGVPPGLLSTVRANAVSDAPPAGRQRALPLVVLSPGFTNSRSVLTALAEDLASHGYAVAGIDHTYESFGTAFPDGRVTTCLARETRRRSDGFWEKLMAGRAADVSFVLNELTGAHPAWPGAALIDPSRIAMAGHSIGGAAAIAALLADSRIRAGIDMDGSTHTPIPDHGLSRPFLFLGKQSNYTPGSGGDIPGKPGPVTTWEHDWRLLTGWKRWLVVSGAIHASFTDLGLLADQAGIDVGAGLPGARSLDITRAYVLAFFDQHLRGRPQALLDRPSARYPEVTFCSPEAESWTERSDPDPARLGWLVRESGVASDEASRRFGGASMSERGNKKSQEPHLGRELNGARDRAASWMRKRPKQPVNPSRATMGGGETSQATPPPLSVLLAAMGKSGATGLNQPGTAGPNFSASHQIAANFTQPGAAALTQPGAAGLSTSQRIAAALNPPRAAGLHRPGDSAASSGPAPAVYMWGMTTSNPNDATLSGASGLVGADSNRGAELSPADPRVIADRGETHLLMGRYEQALADISRAAQVRPADPRIIADRGQTHLLMGHYEQALADISRAAKLDPDNPWLIAARGETYRLMGRYKKALADFSRAIKLDPDNAWAITGRGITYRQMGRYEQAVEDFSLAFGLDPDPLLIADRGETYRLMGRHAEAMADLDRARAEPTKLDQLIEQALTELSGAGAAEDRSQPGVTASEHGRASAGTTDSLPQQAVSPARPRYLKGQCPESIPVGEPFSLLVSIVLTGPAGTEVKPFDVPPQGQDVLLVLHAPGLRVLGRQRLTLRVPAGRDSEPTMFELRADAPGAHRVSVTAWLGGSYLGELLVEITAERDRRPRPHRDVLAEIDTEPTEGAVSLVVRYDPGQKAYRFEFRDEDNPREVTSLLAYEPGPQVERLVASLDELAKGHSDYSAAETRNYLINAGAGLWHELVPERLREQFWERQDRIRQLTILADQDTVPWELLYPMDPGHDCGFLVEQFPVTRAIFNRRPRRRLSLRPARFVLPEGSPPEAEDEIEAMRRLLDPEQPPGAAISALTPLVDLISSADFGLLHFACHNSYNPADGSSIRLDKKQFTPTHMMTAAIGQVLAESAPTVFINACRSAGLAARYTGLDSWAGKFLEAGAAAFIGSLWAVSDGAAREFAAELYGQLQAGSALGKAVMHARQATASQPGDPTWLAYTVYGDPRASIVPDATVTGPR